MSEPSTTIPSEPEWAALAAIDWADQKNFWRLLPAGSRQSEAGALDNTPEAVEVWAANLQQRFGGRRIAVILEQSRGALVYMLTKYPHLVLFPALAVMLALRFFAPEPVASTFQPPDWAWRVCMTSPLALMCAILVVVLFLFRVCPFHR